VTLARAPAALLVVESPAKALTLRRWLGPGWEVRATAGHLLDLPRHREGIDVDGGFEPSWELVRGRSRTLSELKRAARRAERVLLATDPDREGEGIAWQLASALGAEGGSPRVARVLLRELTPEAVLIALDRPVPLDRARAEAQLARRVVDRLIGYRLSARLSSALRPGLTAGRVQAAALRLAAAWEPPPPAPTPAVAEPPLPFTTETLLVAAAERLHLRPRRTMTLAQRLYEGVELGDGGRTGLITYPRTGSSWVSPATDDAVRELVASRHGSRALAAAPSGCARDGPASGQEALRPTSLDWPPERTLESLRAAGGRDLQRIYALIWDRFVESRMAPAGRSGRPAVRSRPSPGAGRLDDAGLLAALAARGVGRPSTFASIGESLEARGYLARGGGALQLTPLGRRVVAWLDRTFPRTLDAAFTSDLESRLDEVEAGRLPWREAVASAWAPLERALAPSSGAAS
jgi:DNA topoisomerase-1